jgi:hypothetical protein
MREFTAAVRLLIRARVMQHVAPRNARVAEVFARAWADARALAPHVPAGQLERAINTAADARLATLLRAFAEASTPANDAAHYTVVA